jgi:hypothetical protein
MNNIKVKLFAVISLLLLSFSISSVVAQSRYDGAVTTPVALSSDGTSTVVDNFGVTYDIQGSPGSTGTVTTEIRTENPQPTSNIPSGISLTHFVIVTFNMNAADFSQAQITIPYTNNDVQGIQTPYSIFKYNPVSDTYTELAAIVDPNAKTFTITVTSIDDPLFAIGGATLVSDGDDGFSPIAWAALAASIVIIVLLAVVGVWYFRRSS